MAFLKTLLNVGIGEKEEVCFSTISALSLISFSFSLFFDYSWCEDMKSPNETLDIFSINKNLILDF
jgi:hypothetical protein